MLPILLVSLAWIPALIGLGSVIRHAGDPQLRPAIAGLLGIGILGTAATLVNFVAPITAGVASAFWLAGAALFVLGRRWLLRDLRLFDVVATLLVAAAVVRLAWPVQWMHYDTGLYHLQTVRWIREHSAPFGLANLHDRLAFNSLWHSAAAAMEFLPAAARSVWFANALPIIFAASAGITALRRLVCGDASFPNVFLAGALVLAAGSLQSFPGLSTDHAAAFLAYLAFALWARALEAPAWPGPDAEPATLLALFAFLVKISTTMLLVASVAILALRWRALAAGSTRRMALLATAVVGPWIVRNFVLSGCVLFPVPATCVAWLPWSMSPAASHWAYDWTRSWARKPFDPPEKVLATWEWLRGWPALYATDDHRFLLALLALGILVWLVAVRSMSRSFAVVFAMAAAGTAFWFNTAPNPRFGYGYLYPLALAPLAFTLSRFEGPLRRAWGRACVAAVMLCATSALLESTGVLAVTRHAALPYLRWPTAAFPVTIERRVTRSGLVVNTPTPGDQDQCWDTPLPCSPSARAEPDLVWEGGRFELRPPVAASGPPSAGTRTR